MDSNVQFLDQDDEDDINTELYMSQPFACGTAFAISVLDCIMSTAYFNENALTLIRTLITGGTTPELEQILAEGTGLIPGGTLNKNQSENRNRPRFTQISLFDGVFAKYGENRLYGELFVHCLLKHNMLCWGVYRFKDSQHGVQGSERAAALPSNKRYVICNPSADFCLMPTDLVYVLQQFSLQDAGSAAGKESGGLTPKSDQNATSSSYKSMSRTLPRGSLSKTQLGGSGNNNNNKKLAANSSSSAAAMHRKKHSIMTSSIEPLVGRAGSSSGATPEQRLAARRQTFFGPMRHVLSQQSNDDVKMDTALASSSNVSAPISSALGEISASIAAVAAASATVAAPLVCVAAASAGPAGTGESRAAARSGFRQLTSTSSEKTRILEEDHEESKL